MTKKEFRRLRSIYLAMYDRTKSAFWFDKVKELTRKYEEENNYRGFDGYIKIHYPDGCIKEFLTIASASKAIGFSIDTISRYKNSGKLLLGKIKITTFSHEEL